jgi:hypothetical protein
VTRENNLVSFGLKFFGECRDRTRCRFFSDQLCLADPPFVLEALNRKALHRAEIGIR